ncbi:MAG TPA: 3-isopropylmalate dehydratase small subunit [Gaiellaceae bacterium]|jgi:3-isopropylmalate/(R)-2-methylmalate dehydratase small subunit
MRTLRRLTGRAAVLERADVDTDQIVPAQFLKRIERSGYGPFLFYDWMKDPDFPLHREEYAGASILITGANFGCGSSREHAVWALDDYGFRVVLAPSFGDIFRANATKGGLATIELGEDELARITAAVEERNELTVDLESLAVILPSGEQIPFELDEFARHRLIHGLDDIAHTLEREDRIRAYEERAEARFDTRALPAA